MASKTKAEPAQDATTNERRKTPFAAGNGRESRRRD